MTTDADKLDGTPPKPGYVTTRAAARLYGVSLDAFRRAMVEDGPEPLVSGWRNTRRHWWDPMAVLKARAVRAERYAKGMKHSLRTRKRTTRDYRASTLKGVQTRMELDRLKRLTKTATARGITVQKLCIDIGLAEWYRSLPPKYQRDQ